MSNDNFSIEGKDGEVMLSRTGQHVYVAIGQGVGYKAVGQVKFTSEQAAKLAAELQRLADGAASNGE